MAATILIAPDTAPAQADFSATGAFTLVGSGFSGGEAASLMIKAPDGNYTGVTKDNNAVTVGGVNTVVTVDAAGDFRIVKGETKKEAGVSMQVLA